jgi:hypothetical protein
MSWKRKYRLVGVEPGPIVTRQFGELNFADENLSVEKLDKLYEAGFRFLDKVQKPAKNYTQPEERPE